MVEPYLFHANGDAMGMQSSAQTAQPLQNASIIPTPQHNHNNQQLTVSINANGIQIAGYAGPGPSHPAYTTDVNWNGNAVVTHSMGNNVFNGWPQLNTIGQTFSHFPVANLNVYSNGAHVGGWMNSANVLTASAPSTTTTADYLKRDDMSVGVMQQPLIPATNDPQPSTSRFDLPFVQAGDATHPWPQNAPETNTNWIGPLLPQTNVANSTNPLDQPNQPPLHGVTFPPQQQMNNLGQALDAVQIFTQNPPGGYVYPAQNQMAPPIGNNMKRKRAATIPIKVVRSTAQYETLVGMGFPQKAVETALRKFNLDLQSTIEHLSEPKRAAKQRRTYQNAVFHITGESLIPIQQAPPDKVDAGPIKKPANLYEELLQLDDSSGIVNSVESFDCSICMETIEMKDGITLRNCLHRYCKDCLNGTIVHSDDITIKCPYVGCDEIVQDREIRAVLPGPEYEKHLMKGVRVAQVTIAGTILCNLPDCNGWCICEDVVNEFQCPQCKNTNCIPCKAIHPGRNCREYQNDLAAGDANGILSGQRCSEQAIQDLINRNKAMKCFNCGILIMKRYGCDYIECAMCKAGICWATRGPRYGPGGFGDLSGGCQCSMAKRCHKKCRGCH